MSLFSRKSGSISRGVKAPTYDPYGRFKNTGNGLFGFRADKHVIMPGVTPYEEFRLEKVKDYVSEQTGQECTLSQELINDVYSIYVNGDVKRRPESKSNSIRHKVLDKVYDSFTKVVTVDSPLFTQILTRELALVLQKVDNEMRDEQSKQGVGNDGSPQGLEASTGDGNDDEQDNSSNCQGEGQGEDEGEGNGQGQGQGQGEGDEKGESSSNGLNPGSSTGEERDIVSEIADKALKSAEKEIELAKNLADKKIKDLEDQLGKEAMKDLQGNDPDFLDKIDRLKENLSRVSINKESIKKVMEKILNESMNYFSSKFKTVEESLFDCEECEDLFGLEYLHPIFNNAEIMSVGNETRVYKGKIDLYLDCSGSMDSHRDFEDANLRMIDLVKGIAMVLFRMGMIENLYFFDNSIYEIKDINEISILSFNQSGGTNFNKVIDKIKSNGNNSVIITDGYDRCEEYTKQAFWVGVGGTKFTRDGGSFPMYRENKQCVAYNENGKLEPCV